MIPRGYDRVKEKLPKVGQKGICGALSFFRGIKPWGKAMSESESGSWFRKGGLWGLQERCSEPNQTKKGLNILKREGISFIVLPSGGLTKV